jgi:proline dehydrogenase
MASRFVAGETLEDAINLIRDLNLRGINTTLDHLGEHTTNLEGASRATDDIIDALKAINDSGVQSNVSIKLTQIGLGLSTEQCRENLKKIIKQASRLDNFIRIDMEDSSVTQETLELLQDMRNYGYSNVGIVIQSYLYRSEDDVHGLMEEGIPIRLCKGAYNEPPEVAYPEKSDVDDCFDRITSSLLDGAIANGAPIISKDGRFPPIPAIATHDEQRIEYARKNASKVGIQKNALEFQMLNGIRRDIQNQLVREGFPVRVYVPYGTEWYPYFMRRLAERPANIWFLLSNYFKS